jgi:hypothetical protein
MPARYDGKCEKCGIIHPKYFTVIYDDRGDSVHHEHFWCLDCVINYTKD